ncbi:MAG: hypothetical protein KAR19_10500 [Bacteroidales bacterium]|nr:hypothetical protein [Bacteroidales bacterium]
MKRGILVLKHSTLTDQGVERLVINPSDISTTHKKKDQKRDPMDSRKIARSLRTSQVHSI